MGRTSLVVVVPYHNEERYLPRLIASLRAQRGASVPVVFVDSASTDGSAAIVRRCDEVRDGQWISSEEKQIGKFFAMRKAVRLCADAFGADHLAFLDADSYCADSDWVATAVRIAGGERVGYTYSPVRYFGFDRLPTFALAYRAYEAVLHESMQRIGWVANGQGVLFAADVLARYFDAAQVTAEEDLRLSLLALCEGWAACPNPSLIMTSARRIVVNPNNFAAWCFYEPKYYSHKDINAAVKLDLNAPTAVDDLRPDQVTRFFQRRALKLACRHLIPLAIFDPSDLFLERLGVVFGADASAALARGLGHLRGQRSPILSDGLEAMIDMIERHPACIELAGRIERLMHQQYTCKPIDSVVDVAH